MPLIRVPTIKSSTDDTEPGDLPANLAYTTITLTDAQIKALPTTPVEIVPAPGANRMLVIQTALLSTNAAAGAYTNVTSDNFSYVRFWYGSNDYASVLTDRNIAGFDLSSVFSNGRITVFPPMLLIGYESAVLGNPVMFVGPDIYARNDAVNQPIMLSVSNHNNGDFTGGHPDNTLKVIVFYAIIEV